jgi:hypothetical protein
LGLFLTQRPQAGRGVLPVFLEGLSESGYSAVEFATTKGSSEMKRLIALAVVTVWAVGAAAVFAGGEGGCTHGAKAEGKASCGDMFSKLNLTDEQKTKLTALKAQCDGTKCTEAAHTKFMTGVKGILTADQYKQFEVQCKASCGAKAEGKVEKKT